MRSHVFFVVAGIILPAVSRPIQAETTSFVYAYGGHFGLAIPADSDADSDAGKGWMADAVIVVPHHLIIRDLNVSLSITHTAAFDLQLSLRSPWGKRVLLVETYPFTGYYPGADYDSTTFDDEADASIEDGTPPFSGSYRPVQPVAAFDGRDAYGPWRLQVYDAYYNDTGYLDSVFLIITTSAPAGALPVPTAGRQVFLGLGLIGAALRRRGNHGSAGGSALT